MKRPKPTSTLARRMLDAAELLLEQGRRSRAFRRRAVSTAYYAVFHALAKICADYLTRSAPRNTDGYMRVYRSLGHGLARDALSQSPFKDNARLSRIGAAFLKLQTAREDADYLPPVADVVSADGASELLEQAREAIDELERLKPADEDCRTLAIYLTIPKKQKDRKA